MTKKPIVPDYAAPSQPSVGSKVTKIILMALCPFAWVVAVPMIYFGADGIRYAVTESLSADRDADLFFAAGFVLLGLIVLGVSLRWFRFAIRQWR